MHTSKTGVPVPEIIGYNLVKVQQSETMRINQLLLLTIARILLVLLTFLPNKNKQCWYNSVTPSSNISPQWSKLVFVIPSEKNGSVSFSENNAGRTCDGERLGFHILSSNSIFIAIVKFYLDWISWIHIFHSKTKFLKLTFCILDL